MEAMKAARNGASRFPFTSTQWQELEHQALVYKYMISGMPIPPDLLFSIKRSLDSSPKLILHHHSPHQSIGWNCFQMGFGRKIDPEPGRCRRTDGKKWRCSKEAYPDSKYCERHMHRGRNRSRKPVEVNLSTNSTPNTSPLSFCTKSQNYSSPGRSSYQPPFLYHQLSSSSRPSGNVFSSKDRFLMESSPYSHSEKDHSCGMKDEVDEHPYPFFSESSGSGSMSASMGDSWHLEPLAMNNSCYSASLAIAQSKQQAFSDYQNGYSYLQLQNRLKQQQKHDQNEDHDQGRCYDHLALKAGRENEPQKVTHHFFDESPQNDHNKDSSTTQLSISTPSGALDFFRSDPR